MVKDQVDAVRCNCDRLLVANRIDHHLVCFLFISLGNGKEPAITQIVISFGLSRLDGFRLIRAKNYAIVVEVRCFYCDLIRQFSGNRQFIASVLIEFRLCSCLSRLGSRLA